MPLHPAFGVEGDGESETAAADTALGTDPASGMAVSLKKGPYGYYVQLGDGNGEQAEAGGAAARR